MSDGGLTIEGAPADLYTDSANEGDATNLILQSDANTTEDYTIETQVSATYTDGYGQAGLIIYGDDDNYVKLDPVADVDLPNESFNRVELRSEVQLGHPEPPAGDRACRRTSRPSSCA